MFRLRLFGGLALVGPDGPVRGRAVQPRRLAVLALLGTSRNHGWSREKLIAILWPETDPIEARHHLSQSIYLLRKALGEDAIRSHGESVELNREVVWTDVEAFLAAVDAGESGQAAHLYTGSFLDGFFVRDAADFEDWVEGERRLLADAYATCVEEAARICARCGDHLEAADWWRRLVSHDPYNSRAVVGLMGSLSDAGDSGNALLVAEEHADRMRQDLGVGPGAEVEALVVRIRDGQPSRRMHTPATVPPQQAKREPGLAPFQAPLPSRSRRRALLAAAAVLVALAVGWGGRRLFGPTSTGPTDSVAVLPFTNLTGDPGLEHLVDGVTDELIANLSLLPDLRVPAQTSSFHFKDRPLDVRAIADSLGVDMLVEGSIRGSRQGLIVTAQLIDAESGYHLWTETYETSTTALRTLQADLMSSVAGALGIAISADGPTGRPQTTSLAAWRDYEKARHWWLKRSQAGTDSAIFYFGRAIERDSSYARAWAGLAYAHGTGLYWKHLPNTDSLHSVIRVSADRANALDSALPEVAATRAALLFMDGDVEAAEEEVLRAIGLNPNFPDAHQLYAEILHGTKRGAQAVEEARVAYSLDPMSPFRSAFLGNTLNGELRLEEAIAQWDYAINLEPDHLGAHTLKAWALLCLGRVDEAREATRRLVDLGGESDREVQMLYYQRDYEGTLELIDRLRQYPSSVSYRSIGRKRHRIPGAGEPRVGAQMASWAYVELERWDDAIAEYRLSANDYPGEGKTATLLAFIYASQGEEERARDVMEGSFDIKDSPGFQFQSATVWAELGEHDRAVAALEEAYAGRKSSVMSSAINPRLDELRGHPQFKAFLARIGLPGSDDFPGSGAPVLN